MACERGAGDFRFLDLFRLLRLGKARMWITQDMHASAVVHDGKIHIFHVFGRWNMRDAKWMWSEMCGFALDNNCTAGWVDGRKGWQRFLRARGFEEAF